MPDLSRMTERQTIPTALLSDINLNLVREHIDTAIKQRGYDGPTEPEEYLIERFGICYVRPGLMGSNRRAGSLLRSRMIAGCR